jgi:predicted phosphodiesterase
LRILLLSDIHSNLEALEACLAIAPAHDLTVNLGDIVGYSASPNEVTSRVRELGGTFVRGNHDKVVSGIETIESFNPMAGLAALWNREHLASDHIEWLRTLPKGPVTMDELPEIQFVHGAPEDEDRYVVTAQDALGTLVNANSDLIFFGHTHIQGLFALQGEFVEAIFPEYASIGNQETWEYQLEKGAAYMINPGSIGQPRDGDWRAAFATFDSEKRKLTFYRVPYELRSAQEKIFAANLPSRLATRLAAGR